MITGIFSTVLVSSTSMIIALSWGSARYRKVIAIFSYEEGLSPGVRNCGFSLKGLRIFKIPHPNLLCVYKLDVLNDMNIF